MNRLVDDLHTLSMADAGALSLIKTRTDLGQLAQHVIESYSAAAEARNLTLEGRGLAAGELEVRLDAARIEQVLGNLLTNAMRHTPSGGRIRIQGESIGDDVVRVSVDDSGEGIDEEARELVFERFYRLDSSRSRDRGGSGLGLSVARKLIEAHGGRIWVEESDLGGARFSFELPCNSQKNEAANS
jgi:two-component system sensor histidine kinase BaeS